MSRYEELVATAKEANKKWIARNNSADRYISEILTGFMNYCGMPMDCITLLPWDEDTEVFEERTDKIYGVPQAVHFDEEADEWRIGVSFRLNPMGSFPHLTVSFGVFVTEGDSQFTIRVGDGKAQSVDLGHQPSREDFFKSVFEDIKRSFDASKKPRTKAYGFSVVTS